jgi:hypothetical protein
MDTQPAVSRVRLKLFWAEAAASIAGLWLMLMAIAPRLL